MTSVGVIAHQGKSFGGGLGELLQLLTDRGFPDTKWYEIAKSKGAPAAARKALGDGVDLVLIWGGDGTAQRCLDVLAGSKVTVALLPAGTANLLAGNLGVPSGLEEALDVALNGTRRRIDVGVVNGERFAIMAGAGLDALTMKEADGPMKDHFGRLAYVWTGAKATQPRAPKVSVTVDGKKWFKGRASCVLFGNMGSLGVGLTAFPEASPSDGILEVGVVTAQGAVQWARVLSRLAVGRPQRSKFVRMTRGRKVKVNFSRPIAYELDGGARPPTRRVKVRVEPGAVSVCVPEPSA